MVKGKNQHVVPVGNKWGVEDEGNSKYTKITDTKKEATEAAQNIARNQQSDTKIHNRNGRISGGNSYGNDPCPPKDTK
jgi:Uncharacterized protein conserved in bacteria (DUF2188).